MATKIELDSNKRNAKNANDGDYVFVVEAVDAKGATIKNVDNDTVAIEGNAADYIVKATGAGVIVTKNLDGLTGAGLKAAKQFKLTITLQKENAKKGVDAGVVTLAFADGAIDLTRDGKNIVTGEGVVVTKKAKEAGALDIEIADETFGSVTAEEPTEPQPGQSFTLTAGAEAVEGDAGNNTITGVSSALSSARTLDAGDKIDGGEGADVLNVDMQGNFAGFSGEGFLKNVETVNLTNSGAIARTFAAKEVTGVEQYNLTGAVNLTDLASTAAAVNLIDRASGTASIGYAAEVTDGTTDVQALGLKNVGTVKTADVAQAAVTVDVKGVETLNITAEGANVVELATDDTDTLVIGGAGSLNITSVDSELKKVDAAALGGDLKLTVGDDNLTLNATIAGGAGNNTLVLENGDTVQYAMSNIQTVELGNLSGELTFSATNVTGLSKIVVSKDADQDATFANLGNQALTVDVAGNTETIGLTTDNSGETTVNIQALSTATKDSVTEVDTDLTLANTSSVELNVAKFSSYEGTLTASKAQSLTATVAGALNGTLDLAKATAIAITQTNKDADSSVVIDAEKAVELNVTAAGDFTVDTATSDLSSLEALTVATGKAFEIGALEAINSVVLSGAAADSAAKLGNLGDSALDYGISLTATGLKAGLDVGSIDVGKGNSVNVNAAGVTGTVTIGDVTVAADGTNATGSITIDANGTAGNIGLGTLAAKTVTVNAAGALGGVGTNVESVVIEADTATFTGSALKANYVDVTAKTAATIVGGIQDDFIIVAADAATEKTATISLTGGLGADTFEVSLNGTGAARVTITDFKAGEDTLKLAVGVDVQYTLTEGNADAAVGSLEKALSGNSLTAILEAAYQDNGTVAFEFGGNTYLVKADDAAGLGDGEHIVILTGVTGLNQTALDAFTVA